MIANKTQALAKITGNRSVIPFVTTEEHRPKKKKRNNGGIFAYLKMYFPSFFAETFVLNYIFYQ